MYAGLEFGDCCLVVDLIDLDLVGEPMSGDMFLVVFSCGWVWGKLTFPCLLGIWMPFVG